MSKSTTRFAICSSILSILASSFTVIQAFILQELIDHPSVSLVYKYAVILICGMVFIAVKEYFVKQNLFTFKYRHRKRILDRIRHTSYATTETKMYSEDIFRIKDNSEMLKNCISAISGLAAILLEELGLIFLLSMQLSKSLLLICSCMSVVLTLLLGSINYKISDLMFDYWRKYIENTRSYNYISDILVRKEYVEEKKVYNYVDFFLSKFHNEFKKASTTNRKLGKQRIRLDIYGDLIFALAIFSFVGALGYAYYMQHISVGLVASAISMSISVFQGICDNIAKITSISQYKRFQEDCERFFSNIDNRNPFPALSAEKTHCIELKDVSFRYPNSKKTTISNFSFCFENGKKYAIVGENGCGKTTLCKIISGLYSPTEGSIFRSEQAGVIFQDFNRYPLTFLENITISNPDKQYSKRDVNKVISAVGLCSMTETLPNGLCTKLTSLYEDGTDLSGGEWQRLALARLLWAEKNVVILDEPTAQLDPIREIEIYEDYMSLLNDKTVIFVTHRLGYTTNVDTIIVIENGSIIECGSHEHLMAIKDGKYRTMFERQRSLYEKES